MTDKPEILFARMDIKEVLEKVEAMHGAEAADQNRQAARTVPLIMQRTAALTWRPSRR